MLIFAQQRLRGESRKTHSIIFLSAAVICNMMKSIKYLCWEKKKCVLCVVRTYNITNFSARSKRDDDEVAGSTSTPYKTQNEEKLKAESTQHNQAAARGGEMFKGICFLKMRCSALLMIMWAGFSLMHKKMESSALLQGMMNWIFYANNDCSFQFKLVRGFWFFVKKLFSSAYYFHLRYHNTPSQSRSRLTCAAVIDCISFHLKSKLSAFTPFHLNHRRQAAAQQAKSILNWHTKAASEREREESTVKH